VDNSVDNARRGAPGVVLAPTGLLRLC
jgi:hypothetical protein